MSEADDFTRSVSSHGITYDLGQEPDSPSYSPPPPPIPSSPIENSEIVDVSILKTFQQRRSDLFLFVSAVVFIITIAFICAFMYWTIKNSNASIVAYGKYQTQVAEVIQKRVESKSTVPSELAMSDVHQSSKFASTKPLHGVNLNFYQQEKKEKKKEELDNAMLGVVTKLGFYSLALTALQATIGLTLLVLLLKYISSYRANMEDVHDANIESREHIVSLLNEIQTPVKSIVESIVSVVKR
ncbi:hypothetical protein KIT90_10645 [Vibrio sp. B172a]|uniref:hypothetical protein n=1 Tax=unclassified Vibrio TaxID=2614977 RepID=UPI00138A4B11|nr:MULTISPECIES: hypothetical protein [unclassified Vibrio]MDK9781832.1 hypothetical protein [Vibrio sp. B172a]NDJ80238.1 hypothetical protein [Vibrio sp. LB10LO1]HDM8201024.1 hypothetical protein [Vibrio harveyi]